ncbi:MAG TPA: SDR family NAD(P)-dependent oxidoreductase [Alphaproteobacteria bacterium]|nr:SDR family NAD(P)-dependent oxidoreductase [Alphaproteobacteria bacterium]
MGERMKGKIAFITGGSEGIGRATGLRLAEEGAHVVICARRAEPLAEAEAAIRAAGGSVEALKLDVGDADAFERAIADTAKKHGRLDALVNNAMSVTYASILDTTLEDWRRDFRVNAEAVFVGTRAALRIMYEQKRGSIVNIASTNGLLAMTMMSSYSASKAALIHFSAVAAMEAAPYNVRVNVIAPGQIFTPAVENYAKLQPERAAKSSAAIPMKRGGQPKELADAVLFLTSDESTFVTGICMPVDGGKSVQMHVAE